MKRIISTVMICLFASITMTTITTNTSSQQPQMIEVPELKAGTAAPDLGLTAVLQSPDGTNADWASLKGKVVVLEFWATWCAPCIAVQPHLNELTDEFKDKSVQFISITNEDEGTVKSFLKRRQINGWIGLDTNRVATKAYGAIAIPKTVIVGPDGKIVALPFSSKVTSTLISDVMKGTYVEAPAGEGPKKMSIGGGGPSLSNSADKEKDAPQMSFSIKPSNSAGMMMGTGKGRITATGAPLQVLLSRVLGVPTACVQLPADLQDSKFDVTAKWLNETSEINNPWLITSIEMALGLKINRMKQEMDTYVVTVAQTNAIGLKPSTAKSFHASSADGILAATASDIKNLMSIIENTFKVPVINETGLQGKFDWNIYFDSKNPDSFLTALKTDAGLNLTKAKRQVEVVVVEQVGQTAVK